MKKEKRKKKKKSHHHCPSMKAMKEVLWSIHLMSTRHPMETRVFDRAWSRCSCFLLPPPPPPPLPPPRPLRNFYFACTWKIKNITATRYCSHTSTIQKDCIHSTFIVVQAGLFMLLPVLTVIPRVQHESSRQISRTNEDRKTVAYIFGGKKSYPKS